MVQSQETARARRIVRKRGGGAVAALQDSLEQYKKGRLEADTRLGQVVLAGDRTQPDPEEEELVRVADTWAGDDGDSDCESVDSEAEESLKHAGVFTGEEVMRTMRDKLIRLQKLYIEQFGRLGHLLRESRRLYLAQVREEREAGLVSMSAQQAASPGDQLAAAKLKALTHYHSPAGREALLAARLREKRAAASGGGGAGGRGSGGVASSSAAAPCQHHLTSTTKCGEGVVPMTKFCPRHILEQQGQVQYYSASFLSITSANHPSPLQVLFRPCGAVTDKDDGPCQAPVPAVFSHTHCVFHTKLQPEVSLARTRATPKLEAEHKEDEVVVSKFEPEDVNGADTDTDKDEVCNENDKNEHDDSKTDSNAEDVDVENETT